MMGLARNLTMPILAVSLCTAAYAEGAAYPCAEDMPRGVDDGVLTDLSAAQLVQPAAVACVLQGACPPRLRMSGGLALIFLPNAC